MGLFEKYQLASVFLEGQEAVKTHKLSGDVNVEPNGLTLSPDGRCVMACDQEVYTIVVPEGVTEIGDNAFAGCVELQELTLPQGLETIGASAFSYCESLTQLTLPESVRSIGGLAFNGCSNLVISHLPSQLRHIGNRGFRTCHIEHCVLHSQIVSLDKGAFDGAILPNGLHIQNITLQLPLDTCSAETYLFGENDGSWMEWKCPSMTVPIYSDFDPSQTGFVGEGRTIAYHRAEGQITQLNGFCIQNNALVGYTGTDEVVFVPEGVRYIAEHAFDRASQITTLFLPASVFAVDYGAFDYLKKLSGIYVLGGDTHAVRGIYNGASDCPVTLYGTMDGQCKAEYEEACDSVCGFDSKVAFSPLAFYVNDQGVLTEYVGENGECSIPEGITGIGRFAFRHTDLERIVIPVTVDAIGDCAFADCASLTQVICHATHMELGEALFSYDRPVAIHCSKTSAIASVVSEARAIRDDDVVIPTICYLDK